MARSIELKQTSMWKFLLRVFTLAFACLFLSVANPANAEAAKLEVGIDISQQTMRVRINGKQAYTWPISTARSGYRTPIGSFRPKRLERTWYSRKYHNSPMPFSIFFYGGYAIHGTNDLKNLGRPVSHGCIRLHPGNARTLFNLVRKYGKSATRIRIRR